MTVLRALFVAAFRTVHNYGGESDIVPGSSLDTPWFFVPLMIPILAIWAWIAVIIEEWLKKNRPNHGDEPDK
jgi:ABC-type Co2+ transport system permease subunit